MCQEEYIAMENISSIYATSSGAIIAALISLKYDWNVVDDYIIKRPWDKVFQLQPEDFFNIFQSKGLFQFNMAYEVFRHLLEAKELSVDITLKELFEYNKISLHFVTLELNKFEKVIVSHKTYPDITLLKAIEMSTAFPILFKPIFEEGLVGDKCYVDGGIVDNYPLYTCIEEEECEENEVLGVRNVGGMFTDMNISKDNNLLEFLQCSMNKIIMHLHIKHSGTKTIQQEVLCECDANMSNYYDWLEYLTNRVKREELIQLGSDYASTYLVKHC